MCEASNGGERRVAVRANKLKNVTDFFRVSKLMQIVSLTQTRSFAFATIDSILLERFVFFLYYLQPTSIKTIVNTVTKSRLGIFRVTFGDRHLILLRLPWTSAFILLPRLSPLYLMVGLLTEIFTSYIVDVSKFWVHERTDINCQRYFYAFTSRRRLIKPFFSHTHRYWWRNLLYINNLFSHDELCMNWTWSMACEMQFFLAFTFILFIYAKWVDVILTIY